MLLFPGSPLAREIPGMSAEWQGCPVRSEETQGVDHLVWGYQAVTLTSAATSPGIYPEKFRILLSHPHADCYVTRGQVQDSCGTLPSCLSIFGPSKLSSDM